MPYLRDRVIACTRPLDEFDQSVYDTSAASDKSSKSEYELPCIGTARRKARTSGSATGCAPAPTEKTVSKESV